MSEYELITFNSPVTSSAFVGSITHKKNTTNNNSIRNMEPLTKRAKIEGGSTTTTETNNGSTWGMGMTSALSTAGPKPIDLKLTTELEEALQPHGVFETMAEMTHRMEILSKLDNLVKEWVREMSVKKNIPPSVAEQVSFLLKILLLSVVGNHLFQGGIVIFIFIRWAEKFTLSGRTDLEFIIKELILTHFVSYHDILTAQIISRSL